MSLFPRTRSDGLVPDFPQFQLVFAALSAIGRTIAHRRAARRISDLPDYLLTDIGLKRDDVHEALNSDWHDDPTYRLAMKAAERRRAK